MSTEPTLTDKQRAALHDGRCLWEQCGWPMRIAAMIGMALWFTPAILTIIKLHWYR